MLVNVLKLDRALAAAVPAAERERAVEAVRVPGCVLAPGAWAPVATLRGVGLLVLEGNLIRHVTMAGGECGEVLGHGDLLRPWDDDTAEGPLAATVGWHVLTPVRLAVLDGAFTSALAAWPGLAAEVASRVLGRSRCQSALLALSHIPRLEPRLIGLLWHLADRFGRVEEPGVSMPLPLTHERMGSLIGARRPSVSRSLRRLVAADLVSPRPAGGWWLHSDATAALAAVTEVTQPVRRAAAG